MRKLVLVLFLSCLTTLPVRAAKSWRTYEHCTLREGDYYDGDSFHVKVKNRDYIFRLYFVDTPETANDYEERVQEQAEYWGITPDQTLKLGKEAAKFTKKFLAKEFTVYSRLANARGNSDKKRYYAVIIGHDGEDLAEALVENGLARIFGVGTELPDGTGEQTYWWRLKNAEGRAKKRKLGGWAMAAGRPSPSTPSWVRPAAAIPASPAAPAEDTANRLTSAFASSPNQADVQTGPITLPRTIAVFSQLEVSRQVGMLKAGAEVEVLGPGDPGMVRIRFNAGEGKKYEAQCRRDVLGL